MAPKKRARRTTTQNKAADSNKKLKVIFAIQRTTTPKRIHRFDEPPNWSPVLGDQAVIVSHSALRDAGDLLKVKQNLQVQHPVLRQYSISELSFKSSATGNYPISRFDDLFRRNEILLVAQGPLPYCLLGETIDTSADASFDATKRYDYTTVKQLLEGYWGESPEYQYEAKTSTQVSTFPVRVRNFDPSGKVLGVLDSQADANLNVAYADQPLVSNIVRGEDGSRYLFRQKVRDPVSIALKTLGPKPPPGHAGPAGHWVWENEAGRKGAADPANPPPFHSGRFKGSPDDLLALQSKTEYRSLTFAEGKLEWLLMSGGLTGEEGKWEPGDELPDAPSLFNRFPPDIRKNRNECKYFGQAWRYHNTGKVSLAVLYCYSGLRITYVDFANEPDTLYVSRVYLWKGKRPTMRQAMYWVSWESLLNKVVPADRVNLPSSKERSGLYDFDKVTVAADVPLP